MKKQNITTWVLPITSTVIAMVLVSIFLGLYSHIRRAESMDIKIQVRQAEFQKEIKENYDRSVTNRDTGYNRYQELKDKIAKMNVSLAETMTSQYHLSNEIFKINKTIQLLSHNKNNKNGG